MGWRLIDRIGSWLSLACVVHCLALPVAVGVLPLLGLQFLEDERVEIGFLVIGALFALIATLWGLHRHGAVRVVAVFSAAIGVMLWGFQVGEETIEGRLILAAGAFALFLSHRLNRRLCESCPEDDHVSRS